LQWVIPRLSRRGCATLAKYVGRAAFFFDKNGRKVTLANIEAALGDEYSPRSSCGLGAARNESFARTMLDFFWRRGWRGRGGEKYVEIEGLEHMEAELGKHA